MPFFFPPFFFGCPCGCLLRAALKAPKVLMIELDSTNESKNWKIVNLLVNMLGYRYYPTLIRNSGLFIRGDIPYSNPNYPTAPAWQHTHLPE